MWPGRDQMVPAIRSFRSSDPLTQESPLPREHNLTGSLSFCGSPNRNPSTPPSPQIRRRSAVPARNRCFLLNQPQSAGWACLGDGPSAPSSAINLSSSGLGALPPSSAPTRGPGQPARGPGSQPGYTLAGYVTLGKSLPPLSSPPSGELERSCPAHSSGAGGGRGRLATGWENASGAARHSEDAGLPGAPGPDKPGPGQRSTLRGAGAAGPARLCPPPSPGST